MRRMPAYGAVVLALVTATVPAPASADHSWNTYHWARTQKEFRLSLGDNVSAAWDSYLRTSSSEWSASDVLDTTVTAGSTSGKRCRATAGRVEVCSASYGRNGWLGLASVWLDGDHITQGTVKVNDSYFQMQVYNTPNERAHVMCQEIGHTLGLGHTSENGTSQKTCMDYSKDPLSTRPNAHDYEQLASIYADLDQTTTVGAATTAGSSRLGDGRSSWGREVHRSSHGKHSTFVRHLKDGSKVVTEVTWAQ